MSHFESIKKALRHAPQSRHVAVYCGTVLVAVILIGFATRELKEAHATRAVSKTAKAALAIAVATAEVAMFEQRVNASGPIVAWQEATIGAPLAGSRLVEVHADVGTIVHRGQVLVQYETSALRAAEAQAQANIAQAQSAARQATLNNERALKLGDSGALSGQDLLQFATLEDTAKAQLAAAMATLKATQVPLARRPLRRLTTV